MIDLYGWVKIYSNHYAPFPYLIGVLKLERDVDQSLIWKLRHLFFSRLPIIWALEGCASSVVGSAYNFKYWTGISCKLSDEVIYFSPSIEDFKSIPYEELPLDSSPL